MNQNAYKYTIPLVSWNNGTWHVAHHPVACDPEIISGMYVVETITQLHEHKSGLKDFKPEIRR